MKNKYKVYAVFSQCLYTKRKDKTLIQINESYDKAVKKACQLTESPVVFEASIYVNDSTSLIEREIFNCCRNAYSFNPESIDANLVYTTPEGKIIKPPEAYYKLTKQSPV